MRFPKKILSGLQLAELMRDGLRTDSTKANAIWPGLRVEVNPHRTGFTVINDSNDRMIAKINLLSRGGEAFTSYASYTKPSSFQKKDLQCVPISMDKPRQNQKTKCHLITNKLFGNSDRHHIENCLWQGGPGTVDGQGSIHSKTPWLIYDSTGKMLEIGKDDWFDPRTLDGAESFSPRACRDAAWLHIMQYQITTKQWYQSIFDTLNEVDGCTVDKRRMLTLAARCYIQMRKAANQIPGAVIHLLPMQMHKENRFPFHKYGMFSAAESLHCLGTLESENTCSLPSIVLVTPKTQVSKYNTIYEYNPPTTLTYSQDWAFGEVVTIPPVGATNLKRRSTSSIGTDGMLRRRDNMTGQYDGLYYKPSYLDTLTKKEDSSLSLESLKDKYTAWDEPWRSFKAMKEGGRDTYDWNGYAHELDEDSFLRITKRGVLPELTFVQENYVRSSLHDFSQDDEHVAAMALDHPIKKAMPTAIKVEDLCNNLVAEVLVNQLPLS